jgi:hypothetical protein
MTSVQAGGHLSPATLQQISRAAEEELAVSMPLWPSLQRLTALACEPDVVRGTRSTPRAPGGLGAADR